MQKALTFLVTNSIISILGLSMFCLPGNAWEITKKNQTVSDKCVVEYETALKLDTDPELYTPRDREIISLLSKKVCKNKIVVSYKTPVEVSLMKRIGNSVIRVSYVYGGSNMVWGVFEITGEQLQPYLGDFPVDQSKNPYYAEQQKLENELRIWLWGTTN